MQSNQTIERSPNDPQPLAEKSGDEKRVHEVVQDEKGADIEIYGFSGGGDDIGSFAHTSHGKIPIGDIILLREGKPRRHHLLEIGYLDPGSMAREKVLTRGQKVKRAVVRTYILIITCAVLLVAGAAGYVYYEFTKPAKRMVDYRSCSFVDEKMGIEVTGKREYSYLERSLFGVHYRLDKDIEEKTIIDIKGEAIMVVGINKDGSWWNKYADMGERGVMILNHADQYVFSTKKKAPVVGYDQFCR